ncbi:DMT family transporter [Aliivibrio salmonicida]|uniref:Membrane protein n=1 Tax=Aliivibrio salmonicida (strain LFI1238) TaxID=316275 RepID=B6ESF3_ALISL|nr:DMT family transporter [Aliivibrio salmonicida]AZL86953.1 DMT family transporter [Aliivibrio salmonicida]CAQ81642.1 membrane protein [Aliivibrio salmonicida LFI1238]
MNWIFFTLLAAFSQSWRNAFQSRLSKELNVTGVTLSRFLWASPLAFIYLALLYWVDPVPWPTFTEYSYLFIVGASFMQIIATALMVVLFKQKNFAIGAGLAKSEAPVAAFLGVLFFGTSLSLLGWAGVAIGAVAVFILSCPDGIKSISLKTVMIGLGCSTSFALTSLWIREASLTLNLPFPHRAAWILLLVILLQTIFLVGYMLFNDRQTLKAMFVKPRLVVMTSIASFIGSLGWFSAMSLQTVPLVKTLGQVEVFFTMLISLFWLKEKIKRKDIIALLLIAMAAVLVMWH